jgi:hypothetical protein
MQIQLSIAARNRQFSRAMKRVRPLVQDKLNLIEELRLKNPTWDVVLLAITDEYDFDRLEIIPNNDDVLQIINGFPSALDLSQSNDANICSAVLQCVRNSVHECRLTPDDYAMIEAILNTT